MHFFEINVKGKIFSSFFGVEETYRHTYINTKAHTYIQAVHNQESNRKPALISFLFALRIFQGFKPLSRRENLQEKKMEP